MSDTLNALFEYVKEKAKTFGAVLKDEGQQEARVNSILRKNIDEDSFIAKNGYPFFGYISHLEPHSGPYGDLSFVIFPTQDAKTSVVTIAVGSEGYKNDLLLAQQPGLRRAFLKILPQKINAFCKTDFTDISSKIEVDIFKGLDAEEESNLSEIERKQLKKLEETVDNYSNVILVGCVLKHSFNPLDNSLNVDDESTKTLNAFLATYAQYREWASSKAKYKETLNAIRAVESSHNINEEEEVSALLKTRRFVVLQGAPGTGKTRLALKIAGNNTTVFEQFHAETTYSDFVYGIKPKLNVTTPQYEASEGALYRAIKEAQTHPGSSVYLIIDEINRANLSNVLGPIFYLFEYQEGGRKVTLEIGDISLTKLPENLYVIATMNTADRSLAVVDFALRRRFAWYTLYPRPIQTKEEDCVFHKDLFNDFAELFEKYATDEELALQPGQAYFITKAKTEEEHNFQMTNRLIYELMPLMKEYFAEGLLRNAQNDFANLFYIKTGLSLYK